MGEKVRRVLLAALLVSASAACVSATASGPSAPAAQGWTAAEQQAWYEATQGSRLMPLAWFQALEQPGGTGLLSDEAYLTQTFGYLPSRPGRNPRLPVGFAVDDNDDSKLSYSRLRWYAGQRSTERWVGLNCAACHTAEITHGSQRLRIDGGPGMVDFQSFMEAVDRSLIQTRDDPARFDRFARRVLKTRDNARNRDMLRRELGKLTAWQEQTARLNETPLRYGFARLDAFGHIYNKIAMFVRDELPTPNPADAPVSYPFLWDIHRHDRLQWNGIAESRRVNLGRGSLDIGALGRNTGEVIGVFGDVVAHRPEGMLSGFASSIYADNLNRMEEQLTRLRPPRWPAMFAGTGSPGERQALVAEGQALFGQKCLGCHQPAPAGQRVKVTMVPLFGGDPRNHTDPWMACNAFTYETGTGVFEGTKSSFDDQKLYGEFAQNADLLKATVQRVILGKKPQLVREAGATFLGINRPPRVVGAEFEPPPEVLKARRLEFCRTTKHPLLAYKARPLEGIWATAPYLHNGSVPTLYDLLLPAEARPQTFHVGTREYDPVKAGYRTDRTAPGNGFLFRVRDEAGRAIAGNSNAGHDYGAGALTERQRLALVEYMKTL